MFPSGCYVYLWLLWLQGDDSEERSQDKAHIVETFTGVGIKVRMEQMHCIYQSISINKSVVDIHNKMSSISLLEMLKYHFGEKTTI